MRDPNHLDKATANNNSKLPQSTDAEGILSMSIDDLLVRLKTSQSGLTSKEAENRLKIYGYNELAKRKKRTVLVEFFLHLASPLVLILLIAGMISGFLGETIDATIIFFIVLLSVSLDIYQESKAEKAAELLKGKVATTATVLRDGVKREVKLSEVVSGDVFYLSAGDIVPADARIINAKDLYADQSALTGESFPVEKTTLQLKDESAAITEWDNYVFMGTSAISGTATAVVVKTGNSTEYGKIAKKLAEREPETEFERGLRRFGYLMMEVSLLLVLFVFFINAFFKHGVLESLIFAVALAVGLTPELLPMVLSVNLSEGALAMSKLGVIVKRLASIENFGSMDTLCTDKTGTLSENKLTLALYVDFEGKDTEKVLLYSFINSYYETGLKSPLDEAILRHKDMDVKGYQKIDEVPFDFTRRRVSVVVQNERQRSLITKGASEEIIKVCSYLELDNEISNLTDEFRNKIEQEYHELSSEGYRVLGVSYKKVSEDASIYSVNDENEMVFLGFVAFIDPPKETARESLQSLSNSGVELKILTGDNELVTKNVCEQLGFKIKGVVLGSEIDKMTDDALTRVAEQTNIFARVTPAQKNRIMDALKENGHVVGFLGDGINDAPSLKAADVSVSVDNAVDVAKEAADIILLHKDLNVLQQGVLEGRKTFGNTMKYIRMGTSSNFGNMLSVAGASLFLPFLPMLPIQILLNNLLYDLSELTIPTDNVDQEYIETPKRLNVSLIRKYMIFLGPISSIFDFLTFFVMLSIFNATGSLFQTAWFLESISTQTLVIFVIRTRETPFYKSKPSRLLLLSSLGILVFAFVLPFTQLGKLFEFVSLPITFFVILAGMIIAYLLLVEVVKKWFYSRYRY